MSHFSKFGPFDWLWGVAPDCGHISGGGVVVSREPRLCPREGCLELVVNPESVYCSRECYISHRFGKGPKSVPYKRKFKCLVCDGIFYRAARSQNEADLCTSCAAKVQRGITGFSALELPFGKR